MSLWASCKAVERDPNKVSGAWVFRGTRVSVSALFENLGDGAFMTSSLGFRRHARADPSSARTRGSLARRCLVKVLFDQGTPTSQC